MTWKCLQERLQSEKCKMQNHVSHEISVLLWEKKKYKNTYVCLKAWKFFIRIQRLFKEDEEGEEGGCYMSLDNNF